jgi:signal transduction histidine kinase
MSRRWHRVDQLLVGSVVFDVGTEFLRPGPLDAPFAHTTNPWGVRSIWGPIRMVHFLTIPVAVLLIVLSALSVIIRFRRSVGEERRQLLWMAVAAVPVPPLIIVTWVANRVDAQWMTNLAAGLVVALIPVAAGLAVSKYHLYDVDRILSRAVAYLVASVVLAAAYAVVVLAIARVLGQQVGNSPAAIGAATLAVAAAARPIHRRVQETLDRHFARRRHDALNLVDAFVANPDPERSIEAVLRAALADPALAVAYWVADREQWVRVDGSATAVPDEALRVRRAGRLVAGVDFTGDPALTGLVVDRARAELDNAGLRASVSLQLQEVSASRARIASAHVEERTRIERDLHDGAQQRLLALAAHLQAALLNGDPERLRAALAFGVAESKKAVAELRELANGLHPSVLQEGGLQSAITDLARRFPISVDVDLEGRRYSPEVETTAWFVVCEAVSNAIKHAGPARVDVHVCETGGALRVTVDDDGRGGVIAEGSGISGILDRTDSIGGRLEVQSRPTGGTRVLAELPCG